MHTLSEIHAVDDQAVTLPDIERIPDNPGAFPK
jgi:hypothetical protein